MTVTQKSMSRTEAGQIEKELRAYANKVKKELGTSPAAPQGKTGVPAKSNGHPDPVRNREAAHAQARGLSTLSSGRNAKTLHSDTKDKPNESVPNRGPLTILSRQQQLAALKQGHGRYDAKTGHWKLEGKHQVKTHAPRMQAEAHAKPQTGIRQTFHAPSASTNPNSEPRTVAKPGAEGEPFNRCEADYLLNNGSCQ